MTKEEERIEAMSEILNDLEIQLPEDKIKELTDAFTTHLEMEREMDNYQFIGGKSECDECKKKTNEILELKHDIKIYKKSVCDRRKAEDVWIEGDSVMYRK